MTDNKWDLRFLAMAKLIASWSKDPSTKVGAVMVDPFTHRVIATGYNGFPRGVRDTIDRLMNREEKYELTIHGEENALLYAGRESKGKTMYLTHPPCSRCAVKMVQMGIARIVTIPPNDDFTHRWGASFERSALILQEAGVTYEAIYEAE